MNFLKKMYMLLNDDSAANVYFRRKTAFIESMDDRQLDMLKLVQGASDTEVLFTLEKRVFELEQERIALKGPKNEV